jgi:hypothetical protein
MSSVHVKVSELPQSIRNALRAVSYGRADIGVRARETFCPAQGGGNGYRCFAVILDLASGRFEIKQGSWGGANPWNPTNAVDLDTNDYPIPAGVAVIEGSQGGGKPVYASLIVRPENLTPLLPAASEVSERDVYILCAYRSLTSAGRKNEFERRGNPPSSTELESLTKRGLLAKAGTGLKITTDGKNAIAGKAGAL